MEKKIVIQRVSAGNPQEPRFKNFHALMRQSFERVKDPDTRIAFQVLNRGLNQLSEFESTYLHAINDREMLEGIIQAEKSGYDGVLIYCFSDPLLTEAKQAVNIPVVGLAQASLHLASFMGAKFGLIAISRESAARNEELISKYGLREKAILPIRPMPISPEAQGKMIVDSREGVKAFREVAREYIKAGAEVLIPACGVMMLALQHCPGCEDLPQGLKEVDGVPILDCLGAAIKMTEAWVALKKGGSPWISRKGLFAQPDKETSEKARAKFPYLGSGVWVDE